MKREKERARKTLWYAEQTIVFFFCGLKGLMIGKKCCGNRHLDAICLGVCGFGQFVNQCFVSPTNTLWLKWAARRHAGRKWIFALLDKKNNQIQTVSMMTNYKSLTWNCKESLHVFFGWIWPLCENQSCFNMRTIFAAFVRRTPVGMHMFQSHGVGHAHMRAWTFQWRTRALLYVACKIMRTKSFQSMTHSEGQHVLWNFWTQPIWHVVGNGEQ